MTLGDGRVWGSEPWPGRLYLWAGGALYLGQVADTELHAHHAQQICVSLDGPLHYRSSDSEVWRRAGAVVFPAEQAHQLDGRGMRAALLYLDPAAREGRRLGLRFSVVTEVPADRTNRVRDLLWRWWRKDGPVTEVASVLSAWIDAFVVDAAQDETRRDPRVRRISEYLDEPCTWNGAVPEIAALVGLSASRLRTLFRQEKGIGVRRYILWRRLLAAISEMAAGRSLTTAAHAAGFSDSAHLTRTFRRMFGIKPSALARHSRFVQVLHDLEV